MTVIEVDFTRLAATNARKWSDQQLAIFEWFEGTYRTDAEGSNGIGGGHQNLAVRARAGTGKTTTILEGIERAPDRSILLCAFNKRIADELQSRLSNEHATAKTMHSVGFAAVREAWSGIRVAEGTKRAWALAKAACEGWSKGSGDGVSVPDEALALVVKLHTKAREMAPHAGEFHGYKGNVVEAARAKQQGWEELMPLAIQFDCVPTQEFLSVPGFAEFDLDWVVTRALDVLDIAAQTKPVEGIDFADMIFLPLRNRWLRPQYDLVVVDEAQDLSVAQLEMAQKVLKTGGRMAVVGDDRQAIYGFRGADSGSLDRLKAELNAIELPLTVTYRCGLKIVQEAQRLVPDFVAGATVGEGNVRVGTGMPALMGAQPNDFILSRTNAPLARVAMAFIRANKRVRIEGKDIGVGLKVQVTRLKAKTMESLLAKLEVWESNELEKFMAMRNEAANAKADDLSDRCATIRTLSEGVVSVEELLARIDGLFSDYGKNMIVCSTIHKSKGLESNRVFVLRDTLYARVGKDDKEEKNAEYVAITRAIEELVWVEGVK